MGQGPGIPGEASLSARAANDFIFSIVCEELGFIGAVLIIILFGLLVWRGSSSA